MALSAGASAQDAVPEAPSSMVLSGRCQYSDRVARFRHETALILCDTVSISREQGAATIDFAQRSWGSMARFSGDMAGDRMTVSRVTLRNGASFAATGTCETFRTNRALSTVSCLARAGSRSWAANFLRSRL
ncbi:hypothetical protein DVW87_05250 [Sphingomonas aracearum]|uniref:Uncharacterized protein n=2 Tax=Sphingomonas aracearum TaxID=2283317 RepID=A0A369VXG3_9SPHN|nr:hypothetical protein DVW87_05250 [Sphingomonas aracearum]